MGARKGRTVGAIAIIGILATASSAGGATLRGFTAEQAAQVDATIQGAMSSQDVPGVNIGIYAPGGKLYENSYGVSDTVTDAPMSPDDTIRIASISKTFTAVAVLRLIDRKKLRLTDALNKYVKGVPNGGQINIRKLLAMTAGIYNFTRDDQFNAAFSADPLYPAWKPADLLPILQRHAPDFAPGEMASYSDSNYILLGMVIEKVTGKPVHKVIDRLARIAGLDRTRSPTTAELTEPFAHGYYAGDDGTGPLQDYTAVNPDVAWTAGNMTSTIGDLKRWAKLLATGKLLSQRLSARQTTFRAISTGAPRIAYGLGIFKLGDWVGHNGEIYGFNTAMFYLPGQNARIVISANKSTNFSTETIEMFFSIAEQLFPGTLAA